MAKNTATNNDYNFSEEEQKTIQNHNGVNFFEYPPSTGWIEDGPDTLAVLSSDYKAIFGSPMATDFKKLVHISLFILAVIFIGNFIIQFGGNGGDRFAYGYGYVTEEGGGTSSEADHTEEITSNNNIIPRGLANPKEESKYKLKNDQREIHGDSNKSNNIFNKLSQTSNEPTENNWHRALKFADTQLQDTAYKFQIETDICSSVEFKSKFCYDIKNNQVFTVHFKALDKTQGYQFTLNHPGLEMIDITPGEYMGLDNFGVFAKQETITTSWNGENIPEFSIKFRAKKDGKLNELLSISSRITRAIAYDYAHSKPMKLAFVYGNDRPVSTAPERFNLYQNTPNPFKDKTAISFDLPEAGAVTLTVTDKTGRTLLTREGQYPSGYNTIVVERNMLPDISTDVLFYTVKTATASATKKMDMEIK